MKDDRAGNFLAGIVVGAIVGAAMALLYAPQSGEKTRKLIAKKAKEIKKEFPEIKDKVQKAFGEVKEKATKVAKRFKKA